MLHLAQMPDGHRGVVAPPTAFTPSSTPSLLALTATPVPLLQTLPDQLSDLTQPGLIEQLGRTTDHLSPLVII